ncbi:LysR substrate-binding domain-containing protein [Blastomonas sp.]|uniref:LysR substrate-binding domain-containing protein n=1 Tax=Blastomonas TaxID=150203 RepID=UPI002590A7DC|nr:LysR substrate-binding domain-containing protein [Blastomonas sp.]
MDRLDAMRVILAVVDAGSLSAGSRVLSSPLASVSRKVAELERHLGTNLLVRTSRKIQLTDAGRDYVESARRIIADLEETERRASGEYQTPRGELSITMPIEFGAKFVIPIALAFIEAHPDVTLRLVTSDRLVQLVDEHVDVAIRLGALPDSALFAVKAGQFRLITCAAPGYLERCKPLASPRDLPEHDGIMFGPLGMFWSYRLDNEDLICMPRAKVSVNSAAGNLAAVLGGVGIARLFDYQVSEHLKSGALVRVLPDADGEPRPIHIVYPRQGLLPLKVRAFIDWAAPRLRAACSGLDDCV